ncbi:MAG: cobalamin biosynthesis protein CbiD [Treponema sp.]|nr:cobalamin biosynthesis protein CbiD [Treponema sp.]
MQNESDNRGKICTEQYIKSGGKNLRCGFTTGSAAAMATLAAAKAVMDGKFIEYARIATPKGWDAVSEVFGGTILSENSAKCSIKKDAGDDPDATDGIEISSKVTINEINEHRENTESDSNEEDRIRIEICGGAGIGTVTKKGLDQGVGEHAINSVPRKMIKKAVIDAIEEAENAGKCGEKKRYDVRVEISAANGEEIAKNTFNPVLGIKGGISILGTTGVVTPMSEEALVESIFVEMKVLKSNFKSNLKNGGKDFFPLIMTPGNFGSDFLKNFPELESAPVVHCSNFIGKAIDFAVELGFTHVMFVGHAGKFVKLAGGIMNTHSHNADCRMEIIASHAALTAFDKLTQTDFASIMDAATVDAAFDILDETDSTPTVSKSIMNAAMKHIARRSMNKFSFAFLMFSNAANRGILASSRNWKSMLELFRQGLPAPQPTQQSKADRSSEP